MKFSEGEICILKSHGIEVEVRAVGPWDGQPQIVPYTCGITGTPAAIGTKVACDYVIQRANTQVAVCKEHHLKKLDDGDQPADEEFTEKFTRKYGKVDA